MIMAVRREARVPVDLFPIEKSEDHLHGMDFRLRNLEQALLKDDEIRRLSHVERTGQSLLVLNVGSPTGVGGE
ncbi:MAG TPA: hypothetical protein VGC53_13680 [Vicinamibacteria bacterium]